jgi:3-ketosteroid 9alpha-monooxygenase subunit B
MTDTSAATESGRMTTFDTVVLESIVETPDTRTLVLDTGGRRIEWRAGQYVSIDARQFPGLQSFVAYLEHQKGRREAPRAYSMSSAPHEPYLAITIKEELYVRDRSKYPPLLSGYLVHQVRAGDRVAVRGFAGGYVFPDDIESRAGHILHLCAGSGSVPNVSMIKDSLLHHAALRHTLIYSNKTWDDVIFRDALTELAAQHPERFRVLHWLTREPGPLAYGPNVRSGRVDLESIRAVLAEEPDSFVYACGPAITVWERRACAAQGTTPAPQFLEAMLGHVHALDVPRERIKTEAFG